MTFEEQRLVLTGKVQLLEEIAELAVQTAAAHRQKSIENPFIHYTDALAKTAQRIENEAKLLNEREKENHNDI